MKALVTGCAGFIGSHLTEALLNDGHAVVGVDCFNDNYGRPHKLRNLQLARDHSNFEFVPIDLSRGQLEDLVEMSDVVFHLAAEPGVRSSWGARFETFVRNNIVATQHLLEALRSHLDTRLIFASSSSVYGDAESFPTPETATPRPHSPYGVTKLSSEQLCLLYHRNFGVPAVSLRLFSVYGPRQRPDMAFNRFMTAALQGEPITLLGDGEQTRDFTFVWDVVAAMRMAADGPIGATYNIGGGSQVSVNAALEVIRVLADRPLAVEREPVVYGDVRNTSADISRAAADLGYAPQVDLEAGLRRQFEWAADLEGTASVGR